jgi:hypothetical protein
VLTLVSQEAAENAREEAAQHEAETTKTKKQLAKAEKQVERLKARLEEEKAKKSGSQKVPIFSLHSNNTMVNFCQIRSPASESEASPNDEMVDTNSASSGEPSSLSKERSTQNPKTGARPKPRPAYKGINIAATVTEMDDVEVIEHSTTTSTKAEASAKRKGKRRAEESENEVEVIGMKSKGKTGDSTSSYSHGKGGRAVSAEVSKPASARPGQRLKENRDKDGDKDGEGDDVPKKKKRKINLFPTSQAPTLPWDQFSQVSGSQPGCFSADL